MQAKPTSFLERAPTFLPNLVWILALIAALAAVLMRGIDIQPLISVIAAALLPAVIGLLLTPFMKQEWAQIVVMLSWAALALIACITFDLSLIHI